MKYLHCTFYRPEGHNFDEADNIIGKLQWDLHRLETEKTDEFNVYHYCYTLCRNARGLERTPGMKFFGLYAPNEMPSDSRVVYFYHPTYVATAFLMKSVLLFPSLLDEKTFYDSDLDFSPEMMKETLTACLLGCTGREFDGAGIMKLADCIKLFKDVGADEFIEKYPELCPAFATLYREKAEIVKCRKERNSH